jgi:DNA-binding response OmpR family regulator
MSRAKILLVYHEGSERDGLQEILEHNGFEVTPAVSVRQELDAIASQRFDALITDLHTLNSKDVLATITAMRQSQPWAMIVCLCGPSDNQGPFRDADHVFEKPIAVKQLIGFLRFEIGKRQSDSGSSPV